MEKKKAVALKYPEGVEAPIIVAKGEGKTAEKILLLAEKNNILIKEDLTLVDMLGMQEVGSLVPQEAYQALALIFSFILKEGE